MARTMLLQQILVNGEAHKFDGASVVDKATGKTFSDAVAELGGVPAAIASAVSVLRDGTTDGSGGLPADANTLLKIHTTLSGLKTAVNAFLNGEADGGEMDRLIELVTAIRENRGTIEQLVSDKVAKADVVNALTSEDATKVLSAAQGKVLKDAIDQMKSGIAQQIAALHSHANAAVLDGLSRNENGDLAFNGKTLNGMTGVAVVASADETPVYDKKIVFVVEELAEAAA